MTTLRAGLAGLGSMGRNHARVLRSLDGVELVVAADPRGDQNGAAAGVPVVPDVDALLASGVDYAVIALPTSAHESAALACSRAGVPCLIEKPLSGSPAPARRVVDAFRASGVLAAVGHVERYNAAIAQCRTALAEGVLGHVHQVATRRLGPFPSRVSDIGVIGDLGVHDFDLTAWLTQESFASVIARAASRIGRRHEDLATVTAVLTGGISTKHVINWVSPTRERVVMVTGERGTLTADTMSAEIVLRRNGTVDHVAASWLRRPATGGLGVADQPTSHPEALVAEHEAFRDAVRGEPADIVTLEEGLAAVEVVQAALDSVASGRIVDLRDGWEGRVAAPQGAIGHRCRQAP